MTLYGFIIWHYMSNMTLYDTIWHYDMSLYDIIRWHYYYSNQAASDLGDMQEMNDANLCPPSRFKRKMSSPTVCSYRINEGIDRVSWRYIASFQWRNQVMEK